MHRHFLGLASGALLAVAFGCASDPTASLKGDVVGIQTSFSYVEVTVGDSILVTAESKDGQGNTLATLPDAESQDPTIVGVVVADVPPLSQRRFYIKGLAFGEGIVRVLSGGESVDIEVRTWAGSIGITGVPDTLRSGETATVQLAGLDAGGTPITGVEPIVLESNDEDILALDPATNVVTAIEAGLATLTATGPNGETGTFAVRVVAAVPASAEFAATNFGAVAAAGTSTLEVLVLDAVGNQNTSITEVLSIVVNSSDPGVATVAAVIEDTAAMGTARHIFVTATGVAAGAATITGSVTTSAGVFALAGAPITVLAPVVTMSAPSGVAGAVITIDGTGLASAGFDTKVLVDGAAVGNVISVSGNQIMAQMPTLMAGAYDLEVSVGGVVSNTDTWTQTGNFDEAATEPNDDQGQETPISASFVFSGTADEDTDFSDLFEFTVSADGLVIDLELAWGDGNDLDVLIYPKGAQNPGDYAEDACDFDLSSLARPEVGVCTLGDAGVYVLEILHYGTGPTMYTVTGVIRP
jgi:hypothetical protein